jgi:hypothetical protein
VTGTDGVPAITANLPQESSSTWHCTEDDTGEEYCQGGRVTCTGVLEAFRTRFAIILIPRSAAIMA